MKHPSIRFLFLLLLFPTSDTWAQINTQNLDNLKLIVRYQMYYQEDSTDVHSKKQEPMVLLIGEEISVFRAYKGLRRDTILKTKQSQEQFLQSIFNDNRNGLMPNFNYSIYKHYPKGKITHYERIPFDNFSYQESLPLHQWNIEPEQKKQYGYTVQKATTRYGGRDWTAWFAPGIPVSDGPYKFCGLPGLIVHLEDSKQHHVFELVSIQAPEKPGFIEINTDRQYISISRKVFLETQRKAIQDFIQNARASSNVQSLNPADDILVQERARRRNNPIELSAED